MILIKHSKSHLPIFPDLHWKVCCPMVYDSLFSGLSCPREATTLPKGTTVKIKTRALGRLWAPKSTKTEQKSISIKQKHIAFWIHFWLIFIDFKKKSGANVGPASKKVINKLIKRNLLNFASFFCLFFATFECSNLHFLMTSSAETLIF